jgi:hypothetical protein
LWFTYTALSRINNIESVQMRFTESVRTVYKLSYYDHNNNQRLEFQLVNVL